MENVYKFIFEEKIRTSKIKGTGSGDGKQLLYNFIHLFIFGCAGCSYCTGFSLVAASRGCSLVAMCRLLILVASLVSEHSLLGTQASVVAAL